ncbi:phage tail protein [Flavobacterium sp. SM2513]|uniref:phage tail protein n=1 Tax=Flavobacterium sp. SM2513 TaxID=3424766 RepID=UPI003D7F2468
MDEFMGMIKIFAGTFAPKYWMFCQGQLLSIAQNSALFSLLGTTYGGDGVTTFALPNLSGLAPIGTGSATSGSRYELGQQGGSETTRLSIMNIPPHQHNPKLHASTANATQSTPGSTSVPATCGKLDGRNFDNSLGYSDATPDVVMSNAMATEDVVGGGSPINNMQPYMGINYIICIYGLYPSRP